MKRPYSMQSPDQQRLKLARAEIEGVLRKHDLAGAVVLHTPGMTEFFYDICPSYSCVRIDEAAQALRFRSKAVDYGGDHHAQAADQAATANMVRGFATDLAKAAAMFIDVAAHVDMAARASHTPARQVPDASEGRLQ